ncbi:hypothetical protein ACHAW6_006713 [Cyclotella cf. meneghiniana]
MQPLMAGHTSKLSEECTGYLRPGRLNMSSFKSISTKRDNIRVKSCRVSGSTRANQFNLCWW